MSLKVSIIGCGWLGLPLAEELIARGYQVIGSTTSEKKLPELQEKGIDATLYKLTPMPEGKDFNKLFQVDVMVINVPPKSRTNAPDFYREQIKYLKYQLQNSSVKRVIFISSTSFYPTSNSEVDENSTFDLNNGSNQAVVWGEQEISQIKQQLSILRCGGLMGKQRLPGKWFSGKATTGSETPVNYIHIEDVKGVILQMLKNNNWPAIRNLVNQQHLKRKVVAEAMAEKYNFATPIWVSPEEIPFKKVKSIFQSEFKDPLTY